MTNLEDFTLIPRGRHVPLGGRVETCPTCGRNGIEERPECGNPRFVHRQVSELFSDGMRTDALETCALRQIRQH
jgi:hypothetical protein